MSKNRLDLGERRHGFLLGEGLADVAAQLERTGDGIVLTVSWTSSDRGPAPQWFRDEVNFLGMPVKIGDTSASKPAPPRRLRFRDSNGPVTLLGCHSGGYNTNVGGPGAGRVLVQDAVFNSSEDHDYSGVTGLRTTLSHLQSWVGTSGWTEVATGEGGYSFKRELSQNIELGSWGGTQVILEPTAYVRHLDEGAGVELRSDLVVKTLTTEPTNWTRHLRAHWALRDLLIISGWNDEASAVKTVHHADDVLRVADDDERPWWRHVASSRTQAAERPKSRHHLIAYNELQVSGLRQWFALRERFQRAIDPIVSSIRLNGVSPVTLLAQVGPGLEALGYELMRRDGMSKGKAKDVPLADRFDRILQDVGEVLPFNGAEWAAQTVKTYNGIKHANRLMPEPLDILNTERKCVLIVRAWCVLELGLQPAVLADRLRGDPQASAWVPV
jgi:hypothetical protein